MEENSKTFYRRGKFCSQFIKSSASNKKRSTSFRTFKEKLGIEFQNLILLPEITKEKLFQLDIYETKAFSEFVKKDIKGFFGSSKSF